MKTVEIIQKDYLPEQQKLIDIFLQHLKATRNMPELPIIFKLPNVPSKIKTHINRIPCKTIGKQNDHMIVTMKIIDFVKLMVKSGIEVKVYHREIVGEINAIM